MNPNATIRDQGVLDRLDAWLFVGRGGALALSLAFLVFALLHPDVFLDDEGLLPFEFYRHVLDEPWAFLFQVKAKPVLEILYAVPSWFGFPAYLAMHALVGAVGVFLASEAARQLRIARPNLAGWTVALSAVYAVSVANGTPNADGLVFFAAFLALYASGRWRAAGILLGMLPLVRHELGTVVLVFAAWDFLRHRRIGFWLAIAAFPVLYVLAGAWFHQDVWWVFSTYVDTSKLPLESRYWATLPPSEVGRYQAMAFLHNAPPLALWALAGTWRAWRSREYDLLLLVFTVAMTFASFAAMQLGWIPNALDAKLRSSLLPLLPLAIVAARGLSFASIGARAGPLGTSAAALVRLVLVAAAGAGFVWTVLNPQPIIGRQHAETHQLMDALRDSGLYTGQPLFSDLQTVRHDRCAGIRIEQGYLLANHSMVWEMERGTSVRTGQREAVLGAMERSRFLFRPERHVVRRDALYVIHRHGRTESWRRVVEAEGPERVEVGKWDVFFWR